MARTSTRFFVELRHESGDWQHYHYCGYPSWARAERGFQNARKEFPDRDLRMVKRTTEIVSTSKGRK